MLGDTIMALITLAGYKEYKDLKTPNGDLKLEPLIAFVNKFIENYCNIVFDVTVVTAALATSDNEIDVLIPHANITSVEQLVVNGTLVDPSNYIVDLEVGIIESLGRFPSNRNSIKIDYTYGYSKPPADLVISAYELVSYFNKGSFTSSRTSSTGESSTNHTPTLIPPQIRLMLDIYKL